jgi:hypothetical protein
MGMGLRIVDLLPALPEPNQRWLVLLGPRSVDQRQGLLCLIAKVEPYDLGTGTPILGPRVSDHGPFSIRVVDSFGGNFVRMPSLFTHQFQAEPCRCSR